MWDVLALVLIVSPVEVPVPHRASPPMWKALKGVALRLEVVGPHERWIEDFRSEINYCRRHWRELVAAPPLSDSYTLPPAAVIHEYRCFNLGYQRWLEQRRQICLHHEDDINVALREARQLGAAWCLMETAGCASQSWACRRRALLQLRELLGPEAYYAGDLPPCVPLWRFCAR